MSNMKRFLLASGALSAIAVALLFSSSLVAAQNHTPQSACRYNCLEQAEQYVTTHCSGLEGPDLQACLADAQDILDNCLASCPTK
jgi:hypothetical protein